MAGKKLIKMLLAFIFGGALLFAFLLYASIKTKTKDLSKKAPFAQILNQSLTLNRKVWLLQEKYPANKKYPIILVDTLHPNWPWYTERLKMNQPDLKLLKEIPIGASVKFDKVTVYTNGVSGGSTIRLFGTLTAEKESFQVEYDWGKESFARRLDKIPETWSFELAPWQLQIDTQFYKIPEAQLW